MKRLVILTTVIAFLFNSVSYGYISRETPLANLSTTNYQIPNLPAALGVISDKWLPEKSAKAKIPLVIHIQDAHCVYEAQRNIASILKFLNKHSPLNIYVEGSNGPLDLSLLRSIPYPDIRAAVADNLMKKGMISGEEYFASTTENAPFIYGVENKKLYENNLALFRQVLSDSEKNRQQLNEKLSVLEQQQKESFNKNQRRFLKNYFAYRQNKISQKYYINYLSAKPACLPQPENISVYLKIQQLQNSYDTDKINRQREELLKKLLANLKKTELTALIQAGNEFRRGTLTAANFYQLIHTLARKQNINLAAYSDLTRYTKALQLYGNLQIKKLTADIETLEQRTIERLFTANTEKALINSIFHFSQLKNLLELKCNREQIAKLKRQKNKLDPGARQALKFYQLALKRDKALVKNLLRHKREANDPVILITGGFHTAGISELLKERGIPYISIIPKITKTVDATLYTERMLKKKTEIARLFSQPLLNNLRPPSFFSSITDKYDIYLMLETTILKAAAEYLSRACQRGRDLEEAKIEIFAQWSNKYLEEWKKSGKKDQLIKPGEFTAYLKKLVYGLELTGAIIFEVSAHGKVFEIQRTRSDQDWQIIIKRNAEIQPEFIKDPAVPWKGFLHKNGTITINLAHHRSKLDLLATWIHELAHLGWFSLLKTTNDKELYLRIRGEVFTILEKRLGTEYWQREKANWRAAPPQRILNEAFAIFAARHIIRKILRRTADTQWTSELELLTWALPPMADISNAMQITLSQHLDEENDLSSIFGTIPGIGNFIKTLGLNDLNYLKHCDPSFADSGIAMSCDRMKVRRTYPVWYREAYADQDIDEDALADKTDEVEEDIGEALDEYSDELAEASEDNEEIETDISDEPEQHDIRELTIMAVLRYIDEGKKIADFENLVNAVTTALTQGIGGEKPVLKQQEADAVREMLRESGKFKEMAEKTESEFGPLKEKRDTQKKKRAEEEAATEVTTEATGAAKKVIHELSKPGSTTKMILMLLIPTVLLALLAPKLLPYLCIALVLGMALMPNSPNPPGGGESASELIDKYTIDLTELARQQKLDDAAFLENKASAIQDRLKMSEANNAILVGDPIIGEGLVYALGTRFYTGSGIYPEMKGVRLLELNMPLFIDQLGVPGMLETEVAKLLETIAEQAKSEKIVLYVNFQDIAHIANIKSEVLSSVKFLLKEVIDNSEVPVIGLADEANYVRYFRDSEMRQSFGEIKLESPPHYNIVKRLKEFRRRFAQVYKEDLPEGIRITIKNDTIDEAIRIVQKYIPYGTMPNKVQEILDSIISERLYQQESLRVKKIDLRKRLARATNKLLAAYKAEQKDTISMLRAAINRFEEEYQMLLEEEEELNEFLAKLQETNKWEITIAEIIDRIAEESGIPAAAIKKKPSEQVQNFAATIKSTRVIGQDHAVDKVHEMLNLRYSGVGDDQKPIMSAICTGPSGVGKTELAKAVAEQLFGDPDAVIRFDMSEYMDKFSRSRLRGAPPGYVGFDKGGQLTEAVRRNPYSVLLFDEIEKAHPEVYNLFLQILREGRLTDSKGRVVDFTNTVIIMTSNLGMNEQIYNLYDFYEEFIELFAETPPELIWAYQNRNYLKKDDLGIYKTKLMARLVQGGKDLDDVLPKLDETAQTEFVKDQKRLIKFQKMFKRFRGLFKDNFDSALEHCVKHGHEKLEQNLKASLDSFIDEAVRDFFKPEFLSRVDAIGGTIIFNKLDPAALAKILELQLSKLREQLAELGYEFELSAEVKTLLVEQGYDVFSGARELLRQIDNLVLAPLARGLLDNQFTKGSKIYVKLDNDTITFEEQEAEEQLYQAPKRGSALRFLERRIRNKLDSGDDTDFDQEIVTEITGEELQTQSTQRSAEYAEKYKIEYIEPDIDPGLPAPLKEQALAKALAFHKETLAAFANLTEKSAGNRITDSFPAARDINSVMKIWKQKRRNFPFLLGRDQQELKELTESVARRGVDGEINKLQNTRIIRLKLEKLKKYFSLPGGFEDALRRMIDNIEKDGKNKDGLRTVIVINYDELASEIARTRGTVFSLPFFLKLFRAKETISFMFTSTNENIEETESFEQYFSLVRLTDPDPERVLEDMWLVRKDILEEKNQAQGEEQAVTISYEAIQEAVRLLNKYFPGYSRSATVVKWFSTIYPKIMGIKKRLRVRLDTAKDNLSEELEEILLDEQDEFPIDSEFLTNNPNILQFLREILTLQEEEKEQVRNKILPEDIVDIVQQQLKIPTDKLKEEEKSALLTLEDKLRERVVGQEEAVNGVADALRISACGLRPQHKPDGVFLFAGPMGVGKTELAKAVADVTDKELIEYDMSDFAEEHTVTQIIGAPPGYRGYDTVETLVDKVIKNPNCVLLFDEIEKAHPQIFDCMLQIMEDGRLTDSRGNTADFSNCIIIMTSNAGMQRKYIDKAGIPQTENLYDEIGEIVRTGDAQKIKALKKKINKRVNEDLRSQFRPEFLNRFNGIVTFNPFTQDTIKEVVVVNLRKNLARIEENYGINIEIGKDPEEQETIYNLLIRKGFKPEKGIAGLEVALRDYLLTPFTTFAGETDLADFVTQNKDVVVQINLSEDELSFTISEHTARSERKTEIRDLADTEKAIFNNMVQLLNRRQQTGESIKSTDLDRALDPRAPPLETPGKPLTLSNPQALETSNNNFRAKDPKLKKADFARIMAGIDETYGDNKKKKALIKKWLNAMVRAAKKYNIEEVIWTKGSRLIDFDSLRGGQLTEIFSEFIEATDAEKSVKLEWEIADSTEFHIKVTYNSRLTDKFHRLMFEREFSSDREIDNLDNARALAGILKATRKIRELGGEVNFEFDEQTGTTAVWLTVPFEKPAPAPETKPAAPAATPPADTTPAEITAAWLLQNVGPAQSAGTLSIENTLKIAKPLYETWKKIGVHYTLGRNTISMALTGSLGIKTYCQENDIPFDFVEKIFNAIGWQIKDDKLVYEQETKIELGQVNQILYPLKWITWFIGQASIAETIEQITEIEFPEELAAVKPELYRQLLLTADDQPAIPTIESAFTRRRLLLLRLREAIKAGAAVDIAALRIKIAELAGKTPPASQPAPAAGSAKGILTGEKDKLSAWILMLLNLRRPETIKTVWNEISSRAAGLEFRTLSDNAYRTLKPGTLIKTRRGELAISLESPDHMEFRCFDVGTDPSSGEVLFGRISYDRYEERLTYYPLEGWKEDSAESADNTPPIESIMARLETLLAELSSAQLQNPAAAAQKDRISPALPQMQELADLLEPFALILEPDFSIEQIVLKKERRRAGAFIRRILASDKHSDPIVLLEKILHQARLDFPFRANHFEKLIELEKKLPEWLALAAKRTEKQLAPPLPAEAKERLPHLIGQFHTAVYLKKTKKSIALWDQLAQTLLEFDQEKDFPPIDLEKDPATLERGDILKHKEHGYLILERLFYPNMLGQSYAEQPLYGSFIYKEYEKDKWKIMRIELPIAELKNTNQFYRSGFDSKMVPLTPAPQSAESADDTPPMPTMQDLKILFYTRDIKLDFRPGYDEDRIEFDEVDKGWSTGIGRIRVSAKVSDPIILLEKILAKIRLHDLFRTQETLRYDVEQFEEKLQEWLALPARAARRKSAAPLPAEPASQTEEIPANLPQLDNLLLETGIDPMDTNPLTAALLDTLLSLIETYQASVGLDILENTDLQELLTREWFYEILVAIWAFQPKPTVKERLLAILAKSPFYPGATTEGSNPAPAADQPAAAPAAKRKYQNPFYIPWETRSIVQELARSIPTDKEISDAELLLKLPADILLGTQRITGGILIRLLGITNSPQKQRVMKMLSGMYNSKRSINTIIQLYKFPNWNYDLLPQFLELITILFTDSPLRYADIADSLEELRSTLQTAAGKDNPEKSNFKDYLAAALETTERLKWLDRLQKSPDREKELNTLSGQEWFKIPNYLVLGKKQKFLGIQQIILEIVAGNPEIGLSLKNHAITITQIMATISRTEPMIPDEYRITALKALTKLEKGSFSRQLLEDLEKILKSDDYTMPVRRAAAITYGKLLTRNYLREDSRFEKLKRDLPVELYHLINLSLSDVSSRPESWRLVDTINYILSRLQAPDVLAHLLDTLPESSWPDYQDQLVVNATVPDRETSLKSLAALRRLDLPGTANTLQDLFADFYLVDLSPEQEEHYREFAYTIGWLLEDWQLKKYRSALQTTDNARLPEWVIAGWLDRQWTEKQITPSSPTTDPGASTSPEAPGVPLPAEPVTPAEKERQRLINEAREILDRRDDNTEQRLYALNILFRFEAGHAEIEIPAEITGTPENSQEILLSIAAKINAGQKLFRDDLIALFAMQPSQLKTSILELLPKVLTFEELENIAGTQTGQEKSKNAPCALKALGLITKQTGRSLSEERLKVLLLRITTDWSKNSTSWLALGRIRHANSVKTAEKFSSVMNNRWTEMGLREKGAVLQLVGENPALRIPLKYQQQILSAIKDILKNKEFVRTEIPAVIKALENLEPPDEPEKMRPLMEALENIITKTIEAEEKSTSYTDLLPVGIAASITLGRLLTKDYLEWSMTNNGFFYGITRDPREWQRQWLKSMTLIFMLQKTRRQIDWLTNDYIDVPLRTILMRAAPRLACLENAFIADLEKHIDDIIVIATSSNQKGAEAAFAILRQFTNSGDVVNRLTNTLKNPDLSLSIKEISEIAYTIGWHLSGNINKVNAFITGRLDRSKSNTWYVARWLTAGWINSQLRKTEEETSPANNPGTPAAEPDPDSPLRTDLTTEEIRGRLITAVKTVLQGQLQLPANERNPEYIQTCLDTLYKHTRNLNDLEILFTANGRQQYRNFRPELLSNINDEGLLLLLRILVKHNIKTNINTFLYSFIVSANEEVAREAIKILLNLYNEPADISIIWRNLMDFTEATEEEKKRIAKTLIEIVVRNGKIPRNLDDRFRTLPEIKYLEVILGNEVETCEDPPANIDLQKILLKRLLQILIRQEDIEIIYSSLGKFAPCAELARLVARLFLLAETGSGPEISMSNYLRRLIDDPLPSVKKAALEERIKIAGKEAVTEQINQLLDSANPSFIALALEVIAGSKLTALREKLEKRIIEIHSRAMELAGQQDIVYNKEIEAFQEEIPPLLETLGAIGFSGNIPKESFQELKSSSVIKLPTLQQVYGKILAQEEINSFIGGLAYLDRPIQSLVMNIRTVDSYLEQQPDSPAPAAAAPKIIELDPEDEEIRARLLAKTKELLSEELKEDQEVIEQKFVKTCLETIYQLAKDKSDFAMLFADNKQQQYASGEFKLIYRETDWELALLLLKIAVKFQLTYDKELFTAFFVLHNNPQVAEKAIGLFAQLYNEDGDIEYILSLLEKAPRNSSDKNSLEETICEIIIRTGRVPEHLKERLNKFANIAYLIKILGNEIRCFQARPPNKDMRKIILRRLLQIDFSTDDAKTIYSFLEDYLTHPEAARLLGRLYPFAAEGQRLRRDIGRELIKLIDSSDPAVKKAALAEYLKIAENEFIETTINQLLEAEEATTRILALEIIIANRLDFREKLEGMLLAIASEIRRIISQGRGVPLTPYLRTEAELLLEAIGIFGLNQRIDRNTLGTLTERLTISDDTAYRASFQMMIDLKTTKEQLDLLVGQELPQKQQGALIYGLTGYLVRQLNLAQTDSLTEDPAAGTKISGEALSAIEIQQLNTQLQQAEEDGATLDIYEDCRQYPEITSALLWLLDQQPEYNHLKKHLRRRVELKVVTADSGLFLKDNHGFQIGSKRVYAYTHYDRSHDAAVIYLPQPFVDLAVTMLNCPGLIGVDIIHDLLEVDRVITNEKPLLSFTEDDMEAYHHEAQQAEKTYGTINGQSTLDLFIEIAETLEDTEKILSPTAAKLLVWLLLRKFPNMDSTKMKQFMRGFATRDILPEDFDDIYTEAVESIDISIQHEKSFLPPAELSVNFHPPDALFFEESPEDAFVLVAESV